MPCQRLFTVPRIQSPPRPRDDRSPASAPRDGSHIEAVRYGKYDPGRRAAGATSLVCPARSRIRNAQTASTSELCLLTLKSPARIVGPRAPARCSRDDVALKRIRRAARPEHEEREQMRIEQLELTAVHVSFSRRSAGDPWASFSRPRKSNSMGGEGRACCIVSRSGVREKIASPMPNGSSRGSAFG